MNTMIRNFVLSALFGITSLSAMAVDNESVESHMLGFRQTVVVEHAPHIRIDVDAGDVIVEGSISDKVSVTSTGAPSVVERSLTKSGNTVVFHAKLRDPDVSVESKVVHVVRVPTNATVEIYANGDRVDIDTDIFGLANVNGTTFRPADALVTND